MLRNMATSGSTGSVSWFWFAISVSVGVAVEIIISEMGQRRESWDSPYYWTFGVPAMIAGALICGFLARRSRVSIGYAPFLGQLITMVVRSGGIDAAPGSDIFRIYRTERSGGSLCRCIPRKESAGADGIRETFN